MPRISSGKRYAQAAFELALEKNELEVWQEGLKKMAETATDPQLTALLQDPRVPFDTKRSLLQTRLGAIHPLAFNLAILLVNKRVFSRSGDILREYHHLLDAHRGVERARVTTALPLGAEEKERVSRRLGEMVGRKVVVDDQTDPSIIGGFIARIRDMLIDGSIRQRLESLKKSLAEAGK
ncbi:MAG: ATP synthase F1 subunit delta [Thermodesulfobacteriota bacterium]